MSKTKSYYIRNIVRPVGRHNYYENLVPKDEKEAIEYNEGLRKSYLKSFL